MPTSLSRRTPAPRTTSSRQLDEVTMTSTFRGACRTLLPLLLLIGAAAAHAQTTPPAKSDSAAATRTDTTHAQQAPKKHGFFSRITSAASHASAVVEQRTGINPENALQGAALI